MRLIENWPRLWFRLWSIRLNLIGAVLLFSDFIFSILLDKRAPLWLVVLGGLINVAAAVVRIVWQPRAHEKAAVEVAESKRGGL